MKLLLKSARIFDTTSEHHTKKRDILIENGIITKISQAIKPESNCEVLNLKNLHVSQGWFDSSVCFGEPGFEDSETIENGLLTAAKSGFSAVAVNPNTNPVADTKSVIDFMKSKANFSATKLYPIGSFTKNSEGKDLAELFDMKTAGAIAFGDYNKSVSNANLLKIGLQYAQSFNGLVISFPQDNSIAGKGLVNEEISSTKLGLKGIPALSEELQIARDLFILEYTGGKLHIPTISTSKSVKLIKEAKNKGLNVSCSVSVHHLALNDSELASFDSNTKVLPPLRTEKDTKALIKGVKEGVIDMITSDHNPIDVEHKKMEYEHAKFGTIGLESAFGALQKVLPLETIIEKLTTGPKIRFGIELTTIAEGEEANLTLFNPEIAYTFSKNNVLSSSSNSIFLNKELIGKVYGIFANNKLVV